MRYARVALMFAVFCGCTNTYRVEVVSADGKSPIAAAEVRLSESHLYRRWYYSWFDPRGWFGPPPPPKQFDGVTDANGIAEIEVDHDARVSEIDVVGHGTAQLYPADDDGWVRLGHRGSGGDIYNGGPDDTRARVKRLD